MANSSIEIEIVADFKDNATGKVKALNAELDKLEKRNVNVDITATDRASKAMESINGKLSKVDGTKTATDEIDKAVDRVNNIADGVSPIKLKADTSELENAVDKSINKINTVENSIGKMSARELSGADLSDDDWFKKYFKNSETSTQSTTQNEAECAIDTDWEHVAKVNGKATAEINRWNELVDNAGKLGITTEGYGLYNIDELETEVQKSASLKNLQESADEYGLKYSKNASESSMQKLVGAYEDEHFQKDYVDKNTKAIEKTTKMLGDYGNDNENQTIDSIKSFGKSMATRYLGVQSVYSGVTDAFSDITDAYSSGNRNDMQRSLTRGLTKGGLIGAGAAIGSFIPGVGTLFGAGAGALIGQLWGDDIADGISGIHKSAEELRQDRLDELFGDIAMSTSDLGKVVQNMVGSWQTQVSQAHKQALTTGYSLQDTTNSSYFGVVESGSKLDIKGNLGFNIPQQEFTSYADEVNSYMDDIENQMNQEMYNAFMVNDDLFGYGQWDTTALTDKWKTAFETFKKQKKELSKYLKTALNDNWFSPDEESHVFSTIHNMQQTYSEVAPNTDQTKADTYSFLVQNGMLSKDAYDSVIKDIQSEYTSDMYNLAETRATAIANGADVTSADKAMWDATSSKTESYLQTMLNNTQDMYGKDYNSVLADVWNGKDTWYGGHLIGLNDQLNGDRSHSAFRQTLDNYEKYNGYNDKKGSLAGAKGELEHSMNIGDTAEKEVVKEAYEKMQPTVEQAERQYQAAILQHQDPSQYLDEMMGLYQFGAMGGDDVAQEKYAAMLMAGDIKANKAINDFYGTDYKRMAEEMGDDFADIWQMLNGGNTENAIEQTTEAAKNALEKNAKDTVDAIKDNKDQKIDAMNETDEKAAQAVEDSTKEQEALESKTDGTEQSKEDTKSTELPDDLGENVLNAVSSSIENIKDGKLKDLELGKTVMDSISESLSTDNMDFKELGFGESLMGAISESLSVDNMDFGKLDFGESLMSAISTSLSADNMDFSQISIGESVMNGISSSLAETDFSGLDIGTKITDTINASMGESVELHPNFTVVPGTVDTSSLSSAINDSISTITENNSELSVLAKVDGTANYELGTYPKEVPKITGTAKYTGIFPTVAPKIYGTVEYRTTFGHFAHGTRNAPEGLAYLNDDGSADPRELVEHNGQFLMYEGRNVLAPLSAGDRVFTSSETKDILSGRGIPHYATGLNNDVIENEKIQGGGSTSGANVHFESGSMSIMFNIDGSKDGNVVEQIKAHAPEIAQLISDEIDRHLTASFANSGGNNE
jgi:hypothetical protein|nr:MAG TPA: Protein of unknown function (DUF1269) [Caudoviricetes sp.]